MSKKAIPAEIKREVEEIVTTCNRQVLKDPNYYYVTRYRGLYLYLDRFDYGRTGPICRLTYTGKMDEWEFAIYKYSDGRYDPEEWFFPGSGHVNGTIEGAMKAGLEAYP
ncbi:MAG: hypothetical protein M3R15_25830 [Acidobacteriota bacterium]|jgi:hypothetical protein|nr:hypothetical protein [Acidobacteriota bacterium]